MKKTLLLTHEYYPYKGGVTRYVYNLFKNFDSIYIMKLYSFAAILLLAIIISSGAFFASDVFYFAKKIPSTIFNIFNIEKKIKINKVGLV